MSLRNYAGMSLLLILSFALFIAGIYPSVIEDEERTGGKLELEATMSIKDHWLNKM